MRSLLSKVGFIIKYRDLLFLLLSSFLCTLAFYLWYYLLLPYLSQSVGLNEVEIGSLLSLRKVVGFICSIAGGLLADRIGRRITSVIAIFLISIGTLVLSTQFFPLIVVAICLFSAGMYIRSPVYRVYVAEKLPKQVRGRGLGVFFALASLASVIAPTIGGLIASQSYVAVLLTASAISFASILPLLPVQETITGTRSKGSFLERIKSLKYQLSPLLKKEIS